MEHSAVHLAWDDTPCPEIQIIKDVFICLNIKVTEKESSSTCWFILEITAKAKLKSGAWSFIQASHLDSRGPLGYVSLFLEA